MACFAQWDQGIIPAFAGNTSTKANNCNTTEDHPRIRGEHAVDYSEMSAKEGSSPHSRGTRYKDEHTVTVPGIIPAFAGNTEMGFDKFSECEDHPRIRGEHYMPTEKEIMQRGSSPHSRGTPALICACSSSSGIIPAFAGNTRLRSGPECAGQDHPRIRGEHHAK